MEEAEVLSSATVQQPPMTMVQLHPQALVRPPYSNAPGSYANVLPPHYGFDPNLAAATYMASQDFSTPVPGN